MKKKVVLSLSIFVILISIIVIGNKPILNLIEYDENTTLALFNEDGERIDQVPSKDSGYTLDTEKSSCSNGSISWDFDTWNPVVTVNSEVNGRVSCNLYFKEVTDYDECVIKYGVDSINCQILADLEGNNCPAVNTDGTIQITGVEDTEGYLCSAPDDYGTSYYYRGNVMNNYVYFAGYYWRIIRINGDGSIRMIYDGTIAHANGESSIDRQVGTSVFNSSYNDNAYIGYMYGTPGSGTYEETHANNNDSNIKSYLDNWYKLNIEDKDLSNYISDTLFCNDRSFNDSKSAGYAQTLTYYRWYEGPWNSTSARQYPRLTCTEQNDRFTVNDEKVGNGDLMYPIGLITTDEAVLAGGYTDDNYNYYLYTGNTYWTMSPRYFDGSSAYVRGIFSNGVARNSINVDFPAGVRAALNLKPNSLKSGDGTMTSPYRTEL